jgi:hypothetical protein
MLETHQPALVMALVVALATSLAATKYNKYWRPTCASVPAWHARIQHSTSPMLTQIFSVEHADKVGARFDFPWV